AVLADPVFSEDDQRVRDSLARNKSSPANRTVAARGVTISSRTEMQRSAGDSGWAGEALSLTRLPYTRREAEAIAALVPEKNRREGLDFTANLSTATSSDL